LSEQIDGLWVRDGVIADMICVDTEEVRAGLGDNVRAMEALAKLERDIIGLQQSLDSGIDGLKQWRRARPIPGLDISEIAGRRVKLLSGPIEPSVDLRKGPIRARDVGLAAGRRR
jgi:hypothetical protein